VDASGLSVVSLDALGVVSAVSATSVVAAFVAAKVAVVVFTAGVFASEVFASEVFASEVFASEVFVSEVFVSEVFVSEVFVSEVFVSEVFVSGVSIGTALGDVVPPSIVISSEWPGSRSVGSIQPPSKKPRLSTINTLWIRYWLPCFFIVILLMLLQLVIP
jgi:hypothetical protein